MSVYPLTEDKLKVTAIELPCLPETGDRRRNEAEPSQ